MKNFTGWNAFLEGYIGTKEDIINFNDNKKFQSDIQKRIARKGIDQAEFDNRSAGNIEGMRKKLKKMPGFKLVDPSDFMKTNFVDDSELLNTYIKPIKSRNLYVVDRDEEIRIKEFVYGWSWDFRRKKDMYFAMLLGREAGARYDTRFMKWFKDERSMYKWIDRMEDLESDSRREDYFIDMDREDLTLI